jgi:P-type Cu2+ transporter
MEQAKRVTAVLDVHPMRRASEKAVVEAVLGRRPGVERVEANPVAQTATVTYDAARTSLAELRRWVEDCGLHCAGQSVPEHICDPLLEPDPPDGHAAAAPPVDLHTGHQAPAEEAGRSPHEMMGHGGHGAMSMAAMVADMRNRFLVAAVFSVPILLWSPIGREVLGFEVAAPLGCATTSGRCC